MRGEQLDGSGRWGRPAARRRALRSAEGDAKHVRSPIQGKLQGWVDVELAWAALPSHQNDQDSPTGPGCKMDVDVAAWPPDASATCAGAPFVIFAFLRRGGGERARGSDRLLGTGRGSSCTALCRLSIRWPTKAEHNDSQYAYLLFACLGCETCVLLRAIGGLDRKLAVLGIRRDVDVSKGVGG